MRYYWYIIYNIKILLYYNILILSYFPQAPCVVQTHHYILKWVITCQISSYDHEGLKSATPLNSILTWDLTCKISWYHHEVLKSATPLNSNSEVSKRQQVRNLCFLPHHVHLHHHHHNHPPRRIFIITNLITTMITRRAALASSSSSRSRSRSTGRERL